MPGRPKPTPLKLLEGNRGRRPLPENEPKPRPVMPSCPRGLDKYGRSVWRKTVKILFRLGLLTEIDIDQYANFCQAQGRLINVRELINTTGAGPLIKEQMIKKQKDGGEIVITRLKINPLFNEERYLLETCRKYAAEFGLSPRGRTGIKVGVDSDDDGADLLR